MIRIIVDSTLEFTIEESKKFNIDIVPLSVVFEEKSFLDRLELDSETFYDMLENKDYPTTSQPSPSQFYDVFKKYKDDNDDIIFIGISADLSGTIQSARIASMDFKNRIEIIDSRLASVSARLLGLKAIELRDAGKNTDEIVKTLNDIKSKVLLIAGFDTLEYLVKGGRLSKVAGYAGNLLKIKPIIGFEEGKLVQIGKSRGLKAMIANIIEKTKSNGVNENEKMIVGYTKDESNALKLKRALEESGYKVDGIVEIGAVIGVHAGPGACAVAFISK